MMAEKDGLTALAMLFKERDAQTPPSVTTGVVINPPPEALIRLNDVIMLDKDRLIFAAHMLEGYERNIKFTDNDCGITNTVNDSGNSVDHNHTIQELNVDTKMEWTDTIKEGDEVILIPVMDGQLYFVIDKAVRF